MKEQFREELTIEIRKEITAGLELNLGGLIGKKFRARTSWPVSDFRVPPSLGVIVCCLAVFSVVDGGGVHQYG